MKQSLVSAAISALVAAFIAGIVGVMASQFPLSSPNTGVVSGLQLTNSFNNALDSVNTANSGTAAPTNQLSGSCSAGNWWLNLTSAPYPLGMNDGSGCGGGTWPAIGALDPSNHQWNLQVGGGDTTLASAATTSICSVSHFFVAISGSSTITSFGTGCVPGQEKLVQFQGALTLTDGGALVIPGGANVLTAANDLARLIYTGAGWTVEEYIPSNGQALINAAIDLGAVEWTFSPNIPSGKYLWGYGQTVSRSTYSALLAAYTITQTVTRTNGSPTLTGFSDTTQIGPGAAIEGTGIPTGATVGSTTSNSVTMASTCGGGSSACNSTSSASGAVTIFPHGNGDGSTTFTLPDCRGEALAGRDNMGGTARGKLTSTYALANPDALGMDLGAQNETLTQGQLPAVAPTFTASNSYAPGTLNTNADTLTASGVAGVSGSLGEIGGTTQRLTVTLPSYTPAGTISNLGAGNPHSIVPPFKTANCMLRVLP